MESKIDSVDSLDNLGEALRVSAADGRINAERMLRQTYLPSGKPAIELEAKEEAIPGDEWRKLADISIQMMTRWETVTDIIEPAKARFYRVITPAISVGE